ncbi:MAG TPA: hypothetical protein VMC06_12175 [Opitutaceae bacterium]|nr:hypothetical protein [Opitutaceae bacterium]
MNIVSWANIVRALAEIGPDRLPKQRAALHKPDVLSGFPPQRGGFWEFVVRGGLPRDGNCESFPYIDSQSGKLPDTAAHG